MRSLSDSLEKVKASLLRDDDPADAPIHAWSLVCGPEVLNRAHAVAYEDARLIVLVDSLEWKRELETFASQYLAKMQKLIKVPVKQITFVTSYDSRSAGKKA
jgi:hypothetical protein